jgi:serine phosphatase RsbU (regulator of sigma subunit)/HAMP domain-containing protein
LKINLRTKLIVLSAFLVAIIMIVVTYLFTIREIKDRRQSVESQMKRIAENIATMQLLDRQDWAIYQNYISQLMNFNKDIIYIAIYDDRNSLRAYTLNEEVLDLESPIRANWQRAEIVKQLDQGAIEEESESDIARQQVNIQVGDRILGSVHVGFSLIQINLDLQKRIQLNVILSIVFFLLFTLVSIMVSRRLTGPLEHLNTAMTAVSKGDFQQQVVIETKDEIGDLAKKFNEMVNGLREREIIDKLGNELSRKFIKTDLAALVRERIKNAIGASTAKLYIRKRNHTGEFEEITLPAEGKKGNPDIELDQDIQKFLMEHSNGFFLHEISPQIQSVLKLKSTNEAGLVVPMVVKDQLFGMLFFVQSDRKKEFNLPQQHFAATLASQAGIALENTLLYEDLQEKERFKRELEIAREVQKRLLPEKMPDINGFQIDAFCLPASEVGGDYYDFFQLDEHHLAIAIADVSGKGTSASFYMAEIKGMMMQLSYQNLKPNELLSQINKHLFLNVDRRIFVTMIYGILDIPNNKFVFSRAGHNSILHFKTNGNFEVITPPGIGLGLEKGSLFDQKIVEVPVELNQNEIIILYTDGVTEAMNPNNEEFGEQRLIESIQSTRNKPVAEIGKTVISDITEYISGQAQHDDITMVILKR